MQHTRHILEGFPSCVSSHRGSVPSPSSLPSALTHSSSTDGKTPLRVQQGMEVYTKERYNLILIMMVVK